MLFYPQSGRARKCSIVQEEDDDEDDADAEIQSSLNRRGSRSEGRINIAVQDRIAESEMLKKDLAAKTVSIAVAPTRGLFDGIAGVTLVSSNDNDIRDRLGRIRGGCGQPRRPIDFRPRTAIPNITTTATTQTAPNLGAASQAEDKDTQMENALTNDQNTRSSSVDHSGQVLIECNDEADIDVSTKFLTDSSTITLPIAQNTNQPSAVDIFGQSKFKTMPSPTRANTILPGTNCLNEIYEEGTDVGSSDTSTTTTPRPVARHTTFTNARAASASTSGTQRRTKFHKTRTASCSSSDDDDSENRKKRAHKIVDAQHKPIQTQRRDSNDDSSDSQDPGSTATAGSNSSSQYSIQAMVGAVCNEQNDGGTSQTNGNSSTSNGTQQKSGYRRHRNGRRRTGETRLRESQSLNRITEVQESEGPLSLANQNQSATTAKQSTDAPSIPTTNANEQSPANQQTSNSKTTKLGFSARLFQGFRKSDNHAAPAQDTLSITRVPQSNDDPCAINVNTRNSTSNTSINSTTASTDDTELATEIAKAIKNSAEGKSSAAAKKLKLLGKYFQVRKKMP